MTSSRSSIVPFGRFRISGVVIPKSAIPASFSTVVLLIILFSLLSFSSSASSPDEWPVSPTITAIPGDTENTGGFTIGTDYEYFSQLPQPIHDLIEKLFSLFVPASRLEALKVPDGSPSSTTGMEISEENKGLSVEKHPLIQGNSSPATPTPIPIPAFNTSPLSVNGSGIPGPGVTESPSRAKKTTSNPQYGGIYIQSYPSNVPIILDGKTLGFLTPKLVYGLSEGSHTVKISNENKIFPVYEQKVWVYKGIINTVTFNTDPETPSKKITIQSDAYQNEQFTINGRYPVFRIPTTVTLQGKGQFLTIMNNGSYITCEISDFLEPGDPLKILPYRGDLGSLHVTSRPEAADVVIDGFPTGLKTPCTVTNLSRGRHLVLVSKPGYIPVETIAVVVNDPSQDIDASVDVMLNPSAWGEVSVNSTQKGASVVIEKLNLRRTTPCTFEYLSIGSYSMKISQGGKTRVVEFEIKPDTRLLMTIDVREGILKKEYQQLS